MKNNFKVSLSVLMLISLTGCKAESAANDETFYQDAVNKYVEAIDMDYAYNLTETLSTDTSMHENVLGFRTSGSDAEHRAADFIAKQMESIGLQNVEKIQKKE